VEVATTIAAEGGGLQEEEGAVEVEAAAAAEGATKEEAAAVAGIPKLVCDHAKTLRRLETVSVETIVPLPMLSRCTP
jgi:hypothetical protein